MAQQNMEQNIDKAFIITQRIKRPKPTKGQGKIEALYEEVIQKNFQTIDELLKKLSYVVTRHDEFETDFLAFSKRLTKFQSDLESIHNEHRRDNLHIISNINGIRTEIVGIDTHIKLLFDEVKHKGFSSFLQNRHPEKPKQVMENSNSVISSTHKLSENSSMLNLDVADDESFLMQKFDPQHPSSKRSSANLDILPLLNSNFSNKQAANNTFQQNSMHFPLLAPSLLPNSAKLIDSIFKPQMNTSRQKGQSEQDRPLTKEQIRINEVLNEKKQQNQMAECLTRLTGIFDKNAGIQEISRGRFSVAFAKHKTKISSIFKQARLKGMDQSEMKHNFCQIIDQIIAEDQTLSSKITRSHQPHRVSREISEILYQKIFDQELRIEEQAKLSIKEVENRINEILGKELQLLKGKVVELQQKHIKINHLQELSDQNYALVLKQLEQIKQECKKFITEEQLFNETFKIMEKNQKKWQDFHSYFANKQETAKAISFISSKISSFIGGGISRDVTPLEQGGENLQTKCICCTRSVSKSPSIKQLPETARHSHRTAQIVARLRPNQLKKKALETLRNSKHNSQHSMSFCIF